VEAAEAPPPDPTDDEILLQERDRALDKVESGLVRKLKRTLQDDQNGALDGLRRMRGKATIEGLLPNEEEHIARYAAVAKPALEQAVAAGSGQGWPGAVDVDQLTADLATGLVLPLALADGTGVEGRRRSR
jgi:hypothetical protein